MGTYANIYPANIWRSEEDGLPLNRPLLALLKTHPSVSGGNSNQGQMMAGKPQLQATVRAASEAATN